MVDQFKNLLQNHNIMDGQPSETKKLYGTELGSFKTESVFLLMELILGTIFLMKREIGLISVWLRLPVIHGQGINL